MIRKISSVFALLLALALLAHGQECKIKFAVVYNDGEQMQVGLTPEQKKMWDHDGAKKYKGMCLDEKTPDYLVLWSEGLNGAELAKASINHFNLLRTTGENPTTTTAQKSLMSSTIRIRPSSMVREKADYVVLDTSKNPYAVLRQGVGYQDVPQGGQNQPGQKVKTTDVASTISDPAAALENALKWLKKEKKL